MPTVSVILNCYNHEPYVGEAIESVLNQSLEDFELILIDNGSTDRTRAVLERYDDPRIRRVFYDSNESLSKRLNEGVAMAQGEFVAILYSDDYMLADKLERQVALFRELPEDYGVVYCPALGFNQLTGERWQHPSMEVSGSMLPNMLDQHMRGQLDMSSPLTRRDCFRRYCWYDDLPFEGEAIFLRIGIGWKFKFDPQPTVVLRDHDSNAGKAILRNHEAFMEVLRRLEQEPEFQPQWHSPLQRLRGRASGGIGWSMLRCGGANVSWARRQLLAAIGYDLLQLANPRLIAGLLLAIIPRFARNSANRIGNLLRQNPANSNIVET